MGLWRCLQPPNRIRGAFANLQLFPLDWDPDIRGHCMPYTLHQCLRRPGRQRDRDLLSDVSSLSYVYACILIFSIV